VARLGERRGAHRDVMKKPEEKGPLVRPRRTRTDNVKTNLQEAGVRGEGALNWIYLAQDRVIKCG
jgi:hypothetical protein